MNRPLPAAYVRFFELWDAGRFWDCHEALEDPWRRNGSDFYQGLILFASAFVHLERRNAHGVRAQLAKAFDRLEPYPSPYLGLDVEALRGHCVRVRETVARHPADWPERIEPPPLRPAPERVRGDEPELGPEYDDAGQ